MNAIIDEILNFIAENCSNIKRLPKQLDSKQVAALLRRYDRDQIIMQLEKMENYRPLSQKYTSVYLTCMKWFELDEKKGYVTAKPSRIEIKEVSIKDKFFKKHPIGSQFTNSTGTLFLIEDETFARRLSDGDLVPIKYLLNNFQG